MPLFSYTARDADGKQVRGTVNAFSAQAARDSLKEMSLIAEEIYEIPDHVQTPNLESTQLPATPLKAAAWTVQEPPPPVLPAAAAPPKHTITHDVIIADHMALRGDPPNSHPEETVTYFPLLDTLRLYAGWLLSWYFLIFAFGSYAYLRDLPVQIPLVSGLFQSPVIISFAFGAFLFLLLTELHNRFGKWKFPGLLLSAAWLGIFVLFRMNT